MHILQHISLLISLNRRAYVNKKQTFNHNYVKTVIQYVIRSIQIL